jgi:hypothetical protein
LAKANHTTAVDAAARHTYTITLVAVTRYTIASSEAAAIHTISYAIVNSVYM